MQCFGSCCQTEPAAPVLVDEIMLDGNNVVVPFGDPTSFASGGPSNGATFRYVARERNNATQNDRRVVTFLQFDTSGLTAADVGDPNFSAVFQLDHVGQLNDVNTGMGVAVGLNVSGAWDDSGTSNPSFEWAAASVSGGLILDNVHLVPEAQALSIDITPAVVGWVDGSIENQGLILFGSPSSAGGNFSQGAFSENPSIVISFETDTGLLGDVNLDGTVDFLDIAPFIGLLTTQTFQFEGDINGDEEVTFLDISPFIVILTGG